MKIDEIMDKLWILAGLEFKYRPLVYRLEKIRRTDPHAWHEITLDLESKGFSSFDSIRRFFEA